jgi:hypothetical protein
MVNKNYANHNCISYAEVDIGISGKGRRNNERNNNKQKERIERA